MFKGKKKNVLFLICASFAFINVWAQEKGAWKMQRVDIMTRWAKDVSPKVIPMGYPRPQMKRESWQTLNGLWKYAITNKDDDRPSSFPGEILVPFPIESSLSGVKRALLPTEALWYKKEVLLKINGKERYLLHFGAVDYEATVYINGQKVGSHKGGYTAFSYDITKFIKEGNNEIVVGVYDPTDRGIGPHGKQSLNPSNIYYTASSGIWQTVWLEHVPSVYIKDLITTPNIDSSMLKVVVKTNEHMKGYTLEMIASGGNSVEGFPDEEAILPINNQHLWSPQDPFLYELKIRLRYKGEVTDSIQSYFGMRKVSIKKDAAGIDRIHLNDRYIFNLGVLDQGFWPEGLYTAPTDSALAFDIEACKAMGFNTIRKHIKVEPAKWYFYADSIGMLVWQDFVNPNQALPDGFKAAFEEQAREILEQMHNYPCIVTWVVFNEKWGRYDQKRITEWVKTMDPSRIVNGHSGELLYVDDNLRSISPNAFVSSDVTDVHSYPMPRNPPREKGKVMVLGEYGGISVPVVGHLWNDVQRGWGYSGMTNLRNLKKEYKKMLDTLKTLEGLGLSGAIYTQPFDVESEQNGIITYDRDIIKIPIEEIAHLNKGFLNEQSALEAKINVRLADTTISSYADMLSELKAGRRDHPFLRALIMFAKQKRDSIVADTVSNIYLKSLIPPYTVSDLSFLQMTCERIDDLSFFFILNNMSSLQKLSFSGENIVSKAKFILRTELQKVDSKLKLDSSWTNAFICKYKDLGELVLWEERAQSGYEAKDINLFVKYKLKIHQKYPNSISAFDMNNDAWTVFETVDDRGMLETAMKWSQKVIAAEPNSNYYDTLANILYKLGKKREAISVQEKAISLSTAEEERTLFRKTLVKMKNDVPTWR